MHDQIFLLFFYQIAVNMSSVFTKASNLIIRYIEFQFHQERQDHKNVEAAFLIKSKLQYTVSKVQNYNMSRGLSHLESRHLHPNFEDWQIQECFTNSPKRISKQLLFTNSHLQHLNQMKVTLPLLNLYGFSFNHATRRKMVTVRKDKE